MKKTHILLLIIFIITLSTRLFVAFSIPNFTYDSYFHLRQVEHITQTGFPLFDDPLSYQGRTFQFLPGFHYTMALFNLFLPLELMAKILPNLLMASLTLSVFLIAKKFTNNDPASLLSAFIAGFLPINFTTNSFSPQTLFLPLLFLTIYSFLTMRKHLLTYVLTFLLLSFTSSATVLLLIGFGIYLLLSIIEGKKINRAELELIAFSLFFFVWTQFLFFKNVLLEQGTSFIRLNVPSRIIQEYFPTFNIGQALLVVSIIPFVAGCFIVYRSLFKLRNEKAFLLISFAISTTLLTWFKLIPFNDSLAFFGLILAILFASFYTDSLSFFKKTKFKIGNGYIYLLLILIISTTAWPAISTAKNQATPTHSDIQAFETLVEFTPHDATILAALEEGHLISYIGQRKNFMDDNFGDIDNIEERYSALNSLYATSFETQAIDLLTTHNINYIVLTPLSMEKYDIRKLKYRNPKCFQLQYRKDTLIYKSECELEVSS